ncbi:MAG: glycosyltransferase, partial [Paenibacillaceae bacterium]|nr:glycosyltransferase [Paenibacillaceae bacterium]
MGENNGVEDSEILISILVAVYNMKDTIDRCIQSLINQTLDHIEIIIVDDG